MSWLYIGEFAWLLSKSGLLCPLMLFCCVLLLLLALSCWITLFVAFEFELFVVLVAELADVVEVVVVVY